MNFKNILVICSLIVLLAFLAVSAVSSENTHDIQSIIDSVNESELTGCCSVVLQLDGNNSIISFRRDAESAADIFIEKIDWHGKEAIKQYKTAGGYFCQVIITHDGWIIGYGGVDDGVDSEKIENITAGMISNDSSISESGLEQIQSIKADYKMGHVIIKAPNGNYGIATATTHFTGKLSPGDYVSIPNRYTYFRSGDIPLNSTEKIETMNELAISDGFGLSRRDVTTFDFNCSGTDNVTNVYISNDDGSYWGMDCGYADNVNFTGNYIHSENIPIAPKYTHIGNITFEGEHHSNINLFGHLIFKIVLVVVAFFSFHFVRVMMYRRRYNNR